MSGHPFETDLDKNSANYIPLSPLSFIGRCANHAPGCHFVSAAGWCEALATADEKHRKSGWSD